MMMCGDKRRVHVNVVASLRFLVSYAPLILNTLGFFKDTNSNAFVSMNGFQI